MCNTLRFKFGCHALNYGYRKDIHIIVIILTLIDICLKIVCNVSKFVNYNFDSLFIIFIPDANLKVNLIVV